MVMLMLLFLPYTYLRVPILQKTERIFFYNDPNQTLCVLFTWNCSKLNSGILLHATVRSRAGGSELVPSWIVPCDPPRDIILHCPLRSTLPCISSCNLLPENSFHSTGNVVFERINLISYSYSWEKKTGVMFTECVLFFPSYLQVCCSNYLITCTAIVCVGGGGPCYGRSYMNFLYLLFPLPPPRFVIIFLYYPLLLPFAPYYLLQPPTTSVNLPFFLFQARRHACVH